MSQHPQDQDQISGAGGGGCKACSRACKFADAGVEDMPLSAPRLTACAASIFLLPLAMASAGAVVGGSGQTGQFVGCLVGLAAGIALAVGAVRLIGGFKERS